MIRYIRLLFSYKWEIMAAVCLFSNLYPALPAVLYYVLWVAFFIFVVTRKGQKSSKGRTNLVLALVGVIFIATAFAFAVANPRWFGMCVLLYLTLVPTSVSIFRFRERFLLVCLICFAITGLLNNYAHHKGINLNEYNLDFAGYTVGSMWLGPACGMGAVYLTYLINKFWNGHKRFWALVCLPVLFLDLQTLCWAGSRSALACCVGAALLYMWIANKGIGKKFYIFGLIALLVAIAYPTLQEGTERMRGKQEYQESVGHTSREALWNARFEEFTSSPLWGVGFGVTGVGDEQRVGRAETGSGWLTVLSQTGLLGIILVLLLVKRAILPLRMLRSSPHMALYTAIFAYMCVHTAFEAYLFQAGWYLCFYFWTLVGVLDDYKQYRRRGIPLHIK